MSKWRLLLLLLFVPASCQLPPAQRPPTPPPACTGSVGLDRPTAPPMWTEDNLDCRLCDDASGCVAPGNWYCVDHRVYFDGRCSKQPYWKRQRKAEDAGSAPTP